jgi:hypothetical protein
MKKTVLPLLILLLASAPLVFCVAQEIKPFKVSIDFNLDESGNANVVSSAKMNASQWDNFKRAMGNNQSLLKREMEKSLPAFFLSDFEYKEDAMNRSYTLSFKAFGVARINSKERWVIDLDAKDPDVKKLDDDSYMMITESASGGQLVQTTMNINFPEGAADIQEEKNSFGKAIFTFNMSSGSAAGNWMNYAGIGLIVAGIALGIVQAKKKDV